MSKIGGWIVSPDGTKQWAEFEFEEASGYFVHKHDCPDCRQSFSIGSAFADKIGRPQPKTIPPYKANALREIASNANREWLERSRARIISRRTIHMMFDGLEEAIHQDNITQFRRAQRKVLTLAWLAKVLESHS